MMASVSALCLLIVAVSLAVAALHDIAARTIPNRLSVLIAAAGLIERVQDHRLLPAVVAGAVVFGVGLVIWLAGLMGGGDVKLLAACALVVPPELVPQLSFILRTVLFGGVLAIAYLTASIIVPKQSGARPAGLLRRVVRAERWRIKSRASLPYAVAIAAGAYSVLFSTRLP